MSTQTVEKIPLVSATLGVEKFLTVIRYGDFSDSNPNKHVYLQAGIHADESPPNRNPHLPRATHRSYSRHENEILYKKKVSVN